MRDLLLVMIVLGSIPVVLVRPFAGILIWTWLSLMNPHRLTWSYAQELRLALLVGAVTLVAWVISREPKRPPGSAPVWILVAFAGWFSLATVTAVLPGDALGKWEQSIKIVGMTVVAMSLAQSRDRIRLLVWVIVVSLGYYGIKGGAFALVTAGQYRVYGPANSFIADNNSLALALIMILPLMRFLELEATRRWVKLGLWGAMGLTLVAILASYSRGALVALVAMLAVLWIRTRHRLITGTLMAIVLVGALAAAPDKWFDRMRTIETYQQDASAATRFQAWTFAWRLALDRPLLGGGPRVFNDEALYLRYVPEANRSFNAHSIYFEVLGETGFVGLGLFLALGAASLLVAGRTIRMTRDRPDLAWARHLSAMLQAAIAGYAVGGAFLNLGFFDLYYTLVALVVLAAHAARQAAVVEPATAPVVAAGIDPAPQRSTPVVFESR